MRYCLLLLLAGVVAGCGSKPSSSDAAAQSKTLAEAREGFVTNIIREDESTGPPETPTGDAFELIKYTSEVGPLAAYVTKDPGDGKKHPAIVWITGGDCNTIGDVWSSMPRDNDQSASAFREAGIVMMFPSQRGGNDNPGKREGFLGEVDDILAATDYLAALPYVDPTQSYLGGHSTGGTMAMLVGETTDRYRAVIALGPVASPTQYGGEFLFCDPKNEQEVSLRTPLLWMKDVKSPMFVIEGADQGNWDGSIEVMAENNKNSNIRFFAVPGHDHFTVIAPVVELVAGQIVKGNVEITEEMVQGLK